MHPNTPQQQPHGAVNLPQVQSQVPSPVAPSPAQAMQPPTAPAPAGPLGSALTPEQVTLQAKQLVTQYQNDPMKLSIAFAQLKAAYLASQYHVILNSVEN